MTSDEEFRRAMEQKLKSNKESLKKESEQAYKKLIARKRSVESISLIKSLQEKSKSST